MRFAWVAVMVEIKTLAERIVDFIREQEERRGLFNTPVTTLYKAFEKEASFDDVQRAIGYLVDRDFIAAFSYSLTAKGRHEHGLRRKT